MSKRVSYFKNLIKRIKRNTSKSINKKLKLKQFKINDNSKFLELKARKSFNEIVDNLLIRRNILQKYVVFNNLLFLSMMLHFDMLRSSMKNKIFDENDSVLIITTNYNRESKKIILKI